MKELINEAFRVVMGVEENSYALYRRAALAMPAGDAREVLERVAAREAALLEDLGGHCPFTVTRPRQETDGCEPTRAESYHKDRVERALFHHLRVALLDKHRSLEGYAAFVRSLREPAVCRVFELAYELSRKVFEVIADEYRRAELKVHQPGSNRRLKRSHLRPGNRAIPNKHSQLFISLLDAGRRFPC